jgi:Na+-driven multidrug efflux pump
MVGRLLKLAAPASIRGTERASSQLALLWIVSPFGDIPLAAYSLTRRLEQFSSFGSGGIAQAAGVMVGQNLGAKKPERARSALKWALLFVTTMKGSILASLWIFAAGAVMVFTHDADVVDLTVQWMRIQLISALFQGIMMVYQESYHGAGDTLAPLVVTLIGVWAIEVPLAYWLCLHTSLGAIGIAWAAIAGFGSRAVFFAVYYFSGRWLRVKVL